MNVAINSQVQSPFVRTLEAVPTKGGSFTHHIPDNIPPVDKSKIVVPHQQTLSANAAQTLTFNVPQHGYLNKCVARMKFTVTHNCATPATAGAGTFPALYNDGMLALVNSATLNTRNRPIERRYGRQMYADILTDDLSEKTRKLQLLRPHHVSVLRAGTGGAEPAAAVGRFTDCGIDGNDGAPTRLNTSTQVSTLFAVPETNLVAGARSYTSTFYSYVEIPFSSFDSLASNYNTRFVEPMSVKLDLAAQPATTIGGMVSKVAGTFPAYVGTTTTAITGVDLMCYFTNYHDLTEQDIRDANFKPDAPAVVFGWDVREENSLAVTAVTAETDFAVNIRSNNIAKQLMVLYVPDALQSAGHTDTCVSLQHQFLSLTNLKFSGSGQTIYEGNSIENALLDRYDYPLSTWSNKTYNSFEAGDSELLGVHLIDFGLSQNPTYNSGCLGLQTVSNPQVVASVLGTTPIPAIAGKLYVYVKHHSLTQIDSGTGAISRSIDA